MIKYLLTKQDEKRAKLVCNKILTNDFTPQYIDKNTGFLTDVISKIMPKRYENSNLLMEFSILMDDILDMSSISQEEKNKAIDNLLSNTKDELFILSKDLLLKIESDQKEAIKSGYCPELMNK